MIKKIFFVLFISLFLCNISFAATISEQEQKFIEYQTSKTINNVKMYRAAIYKYLEVTPPQAIEINKLDKQFYSQIKPIFMDDFHTLNRLSRLTNQKKPPKKLVSAEKKKLKSNNKILDEYKDDYENELYQILTPAQKAKYLKLKKERLKEYKQTSLR